MNTDVQPHAPISHLQQFCFFIIIIALDRKNVQKMPDALTYMKTFERADPEKRTKLQQNVLLLEKGQRWCQDVFLSAGLRHKLLVTRRGVQPFGYGYLQRMGFIRGISLVQVSSLICTQETLGMGTHQGAKPASVKRKTPGAAGTEIKAIKK